MRRWGAGDVQSRATGGKNGCGGGGGGQAAVVVVRRQRDRQWERCRQATERERQLRLRRAHSRRTRLALLPMADREQQYVRRVEGLFPPALWPCHFTLRPDRPTSRPTEAPSLLPAARLGLAGDLRCSGLGSWLLRKGCLSRLSRL